jgi:hypothetical protein
MFYLEIKSTLVILWSIFIPLINNAMNNIYQLVLISCAILSLSPWPLIPLTTIPKSENFRFQKRVWSQGFRIRDCVPVLAQLVEKMSRLSRISNVRRLRDTATGVYPGAVESSHNYHRQFVNIHFNIILTSTHTYPWRSLYFTKTTVFWDDVPCSLVKLANVSEVLNTFIIRATSEDWNLIFLHVFGTEIFVSSRYIIGPYHHPCFNRPKIWEQLWSPYCGIFFGTFMSHSNKWSPHYFILNSLYSCSADQVSHPYVTSCYDVRYTRILY